MNHIDIKSITILFNSYYSTFKYYNTLKNRLINEELYLNKIKQKITNILILDKDNLLEWRGLYKYIISNLFIYFIDITTIKIYFLGDVSRIPWIIFKGLPINYNSFYISNNYNNNDLYIKIYSIFNLSKSIDNLD